MTSPTSLGIAIDDPFNFFSGKLDIHSRQALSFMTMGQGHVSPWVFIQSSFKETIFFLYSTASTATRGTRSY
jgi:hypothetical protein